MFRLILFSVILFCCCAWFPVTAGAVDDHLDRMRQIRPLALTHSPVSGLPVGVEFESFVQVTSNNDINAPVSNNTGQTVFFAELMGPGINTENNGSLWMESQGKLKLLAREGQLAPGASPGVAFASIYGSFPAIGDDGTVVFGALVRNASQQFEQGIWVHKGEELGLLALENADLPASPSWRVDATTSNYRVNNAGQIAVWLKRTRKRNGAQRSGIYFFDDLNKVNSIVETTLPATGIASTYRSVAQRSFALNDAGQISYVAVTEASGIGVKRDSGIWLANTTSQQLLLREGDRAPGVLRGTVFENIDGGTPFQAPLTLNQDGTINFWGVLAGSSLTKRRGIWTIDGGEITNRLLNFDEPLPGYPGIQIGTIPSGTNKPPVAMNASGEIAYLATLIGAVTEDDDLAILRERGSGIEMVARTGSPAPGTPEGSVFQTFSVLGAGLAYNAAGQIAFEGRYLDPATSELGMGIWAEDQMSELQLVIRTGDVLQVAAGDSRTVQRLNFMPGSGNTDGRRSGFDDSGRLAFHATFTDGTAGMFVSQIVAIPEPATAAMLLVAVNLLVSLRRRI